MRWLVVVGAVRGWGDARDWYRLGVHEPLTRLADGTDLTSRVREGHLPDYVLREADRLQLRPALRAAAAGERPAVRLVVIVGESAASKSRMAAEAAQAVLGDWQLVVPRTAADLTALHDGSGPVARVSVWLDEVQDLLAQPGGAEAVQKLLDRPSGRGRQPSASLPSRHGSRPATRPTRSWTATSNR